MFEEFLCADRPSCPLRPIDPQSFKGFNPYQEGSGCDFKKCCKKYKRGKQCKKCPKR